MLYNVGSQAKTLMFVHKRPDLDYVGETLSTLDFVERIAIVEFGAARSIERVVCIVFIIQSLLLSWNIQQHWSFLPITISFQVKFMVILVI
ncbi:putative minus-end-directed kinesin ATPase [Helianthus anomalus]